MARIHANLITKGFKTISDVPANMQVDVQSVDLERENV